MPILTFARFAHKDGGQTQKPRAARQQQQQHIQRLLLLGLTVHISKSHLPRLSLCNPRDMCWYGRTIEKEEREFPGPLGDVLRDNDAHKSTRSRVRVWPVWQLVKDWLPKSGTIIIMRECAKINSLFGVEIHSNIWKQYKNPTRLHWSWISGPGMR